MRRSLQGGRGQVYSYVFERLVSVMSEPGGGGGVIRAFKIYLFVQFIFSKRL